MGGVARGSLALGFVASRLVEAAVIMIGVVCLLAVVTMRQDVAGSGADAASLAVTANALVDVRNWTFLFGPGLMPVFNAVLFGTLFYKSRLVPRIIPAVRLIGAPLLFIAFIASLFGVFDQVSAASFALTLPIAAWELSVGIWMTFMGFRPEAVDAGGAIICSYSVTTLGVMIMMKAASVLTGWAGASVVAAGQLCHGWAMGTSNSHEMAFRQSRTAQDRMTSPRR